MTGTLQRRTLLKILAGLPAGLASIRSVRAQSKRSWPQYQFDPANTGSSSSVRGPAEGVGLRWTATPASEGITTHSTLVDGTLFIGSWDDHLYALDTATGNVNWKRDLGHSIHFPAPAVGSGRVIIGTEEGKLHALTIENGRIDWTVDTGSAITGSATIADGTVYVPNTAGTLLALSLENGSERWRFETSGIQPMLTTPAVKDGTVYIGSMVFNEIPENQSDLDPFAIDNKEKLEQLDAEGRLYAIRTTDGELRWEAQTDHVIVASPVVSDDAIYVGSWDKFCYALSPKDGSQQWLASLSDVITAPPVLVDDRLYVGAWDGEVFALRTTDGSTVWRTSTEGHIVAPPVSDGERLYATDDKRVVSLRLQDGAEQWQFNTQAWDVWAPALGDGTVYATDGSGRVFALEPGASIELQASESSGSNRAFSGDRGFFTNNGDPPIEALSNPFVLTIGGFILSVIGIVHQMMSGR